MSIFSDVVGYKWISCGRKERSQTPNNVVRPPTPPLSFLSSRRKLQILKYFGHLRGSLSSNIDIQTTSMKIQMYIVIFHVLNRRNNKRDMQSPRVFSQTFMTPHSSKATQLYGLMPIYS